MKSRLLRYWTYFRRAHSIYLAFFISFLNFVAIQYTLIIKRSLLQSIFTTLWVFALAFLVGYIPLAILLGWIDYKYGSVSVDIELSGQASPWVQDLAEAFILLAEGKNQEATRIMDKWVRK